MLKWIVVPENIPQKHFRKIMKWITAHMHAPIRIRYCTYTQGSELLSQLSNGYTILYNYNINVDTLSGKFSQLLHVQNSMI